jgi:hypothetical protein
LIALQYRQIAAETYRTLRVQFTLARRKKAVSTLRDMRSRLFDEFMALDQKLTSAPDPGSSAVKP